MYENLLWVPLFFGGISITLYLVLSRIALKAAVRRKLMIPRTDEEGFRAKKPLKSDDLFLLSIKNRLIYLIPFKIKNSVETALNLSGFKWQIGDVILLKILLALICIFVIFLSIQRVENFVLKYILISIAAILGFMIPDILLKSKAKSRRQGIIRSLPSFIDYLTICIEAGLALDISIFKIIGKIRGPLAEEVANTMAEIKYGKSKKDAFRGLAARVNMPDFTSFLNALINGEQLGVSLGNILRVQGQQIRDKRKQKIQEDAYKIPVKLTFPLVLCVLPGLFIIILGPAVLQVMDALFK